MTNVELENKRLKEVIRILMQDMQPDHCKNAVGEKCKDCKFKSECYKRYMVVANEEYSLRNYKKYLWDTACGKIQE